MRADYRELSATMVCASPWLLTWGVNQVSAFNTDRVTLSICQHTEAKSKGVVFSVLLTPEVPSEASGPCRG